MSNPPRKIIHLPKVRMLSRGGSRPAQGIRITNVKSIRPPHPEAAKNEEDKLRAQLQKEIVSRSRACAYKRDNCVMPVLWGRQYCARHIVHDPASPYVRCAHDQCDMAAMKNNSEHQLCFEHARAALCARQRSAAPPPPAVSTESLLLQLQHYVKPERTRTTSCASVVSVVSEPAELELAEPSAVDPFTLVCSGSKIARAPSEVPGALASILGTIVPHLPPEQIDATSVNASYSSTIMECASASESDADSVSVRDSDEPSDAEDAPAEEQPLWRAGVFTAEEAVSEAKSALCSLQTAYLGQMGRLRTLLQAARSQYLKALKAEKEQYCSISSQSLSGPLTVRERRQLRKLKAFASYRRKHGVEAILQRKLHHKRAKVNGPPTSRPLPSAARCRRAEGGVRCALPALPAARHCRRHCVLDRSQVLFVACGDPRGGVSCAEPVPRLPLPAACRYHADPPPYAAFSLKKDDSDTESDSNTSVDSQLTNMETDEAPADLNEPLMG